ncbi:CPBP family intramembrane glutamic endopeptidase [Mucilaginibacter sp. KACC 22063]|uniref:CPBP family intramembrane glutamic endopeptidase n=1 Tax=Mucilaginibacter sp. KACC 22063 TaxID=3025666 RepID=UPI002366A62E|nr:CPBP family intramembrane glutamic endopeptidase [Mucilaginibacter sp. KACC 22063]WDF54877.1 CPBP family intramembrane metalloprotease [Mucilaginibacter sp. KACC 22063]
MSTYLKQIASFTTNPDRTYIGQTFSVKEKCYDVIKSVVLYLMLSLIACIPIFSVLKLIDFLFKIDMAQVRDNFVKKSINKSDFIWVAALLAPIIEEVVFRLWLSFKKRDIVISLTLISLLIAVKLNGHHIYQLQVDEIIKLLGIATLSGIIILFLSRRIPTVEITNLAFKSIYWISCALFGLLHITNFGTFNWKIAWAYPFFVIPQLLLGCILGFIRIKDGLIWAIMVHCLVNFILVKL